MAYEISFDLSAIEGMLDKLGAAANGAAARGMYEAAGMIADGLSGAINGIRTEPFHYAKNGEKRLASPEEKAAVLQGKYGIAKFRKNWDSVETSIGIGNAGYATFSDNEDFGVFGKMNRGSRRGEKGVPIPLIIHAIDSGTSFMQAQPFLEKTFSRKKNAAIARMSAIIDQEMQKILDEE